MSSKLYSKLLLLYFFIAKIIKCAVEPPRATFSDEETIKILDDYKSSINCLKLTLKTFMENGGGRLALEVYIISKLDKGLTYLTAKKKFEKKIRNVLKDDKKISHHFKNEIEKIEESISFLSPTKQKAEMNIIEFIKKIGDTSDVHVLYKEILNGLKDVIYPLYLFSYIVQNYRNEFFENSDQLQLLAAVGGVINEFKDTLEYVLKCLTKKEYFEKVADFKGADQGLQMGNYLLVISGLVLGGLFSFFVTKITKKSA